MDRHGLPEFDLTRKVLESICEYSAVGQHLSYAFANSCGIRGVPIARSSRFLRSCHVRLCSLLLLARRVSGYGRSFKTKGSAMDNVNDSVGGMPRIEVPSVNAVKRRRDSSRAGLCARSASYWIGNSVARSPGFVRLRVQGTRSFVRREVVACRHCASKGLNIRWMVLRSNLLIFRT